MIIYNKDDAEKDDDGGLRYGDGTDYGAGDFEQFPDAGGGVGMRRRPVNYGGASGGAGGETMTVPRDLYPVDWSAPRDTGVSAPAPPPIGGMPYGDPASGVSAPYGGPPIEQWFQELIARQQPQRPRMMSPWARLFRR